MSAAEKPALSIPQLAAEGEAAPLSAPFTFGIAQSLRGR